MLIDDVKVKLEAGSGGKGSVSFNKIPMSLGPVGGTGGNGGSSSEDNTKTVGQAAAHDNDAMKVDNELFIRETA